MSTNLRESDRPTAEEFRTRLEELLRTADDRGVAFDRAWEIESGDEETSLMIEITRVVPRTTAAER